MPNANPLTNTDSPPQHSKDTKNYMCQCCFILPVRLPVSHTESLQPLCTRCTSHYGRVSQTLAAHRAIVGEFVVDRNAQVRELNTVAKDSKDAMEKAQASLRELEAYIAGEYEDKPIGDMHAALESAILNDSLGKRDAAYRARDRIFIGLYKLDDLHRENPNGRCACGKALKDCEEYQAIKPIAIEYYRWENQQIDRMNEGKHHGLSYDHPKGREWRGRFPGEYWRGASE